MSDPGRTRPTDALLPVLEIGGTHVLAGVVDTAAWSVDHARRTPLDASASAGDLLDAFATALPEPEMPSAARWAIAIPGPFDYENGIGSFDGVAKFGSLRDVDVRAGLRDRLPGSPDLVFVNDASAAAIGEWHAAGRPAHRTLYLALGTGIGSAFLDDGRPVTDAPGLPDNGYLYLLEWQGRPLEESVSRRAIRAKYLAAGGDDADVREIAGRARLGESVARSVLEEAFRTLGTAIGPVIRAFGAAEVVVGGSIAESWDVLADPLAEGLLAASPSAPVALRKARSESASALIGAAIAVTRR